MPGPVPPIEPITADSLGDFCVFLHESLSSDRSPEEWLAGFAVPWECRRPNYGFMLRDANGRIVGGLGAIYSWQLIKGQEYDFCNLTSWCVKEEFRSQSMRLAMAVTAQDGFEFTNFSPTKVVASVLRFLNFKELDERVSFFPNLPAVHGRFGSAAVESDPKELDRVLDGALGKIYHDHAPYPWLSCLLLTAESAQCLVIFKRTRVRSVIGAKILYVSNRELYARHLRLVSSHLLSRFGLFFTQIESRFLERRVAFSREASGYTKKLFLSHRLLASDIDYIYSESMCLDL